jgi:uncharacterized membrane protein
MIVEHSGVDPEVLQRARRRYRVLTALVLGGLTVGLTLAWIVVVTVSSDRPQGQTARVIVFGVGLTVVTVLLTAAGMWWTARSARRRGRPLPSPLLGADRATRRRIMQAIRRQEPLAGHDRALARDAAERIQTLGTTNAAVLASSAVLLLISAALLIADGQDWWRVAPQLLMAPFLVVVLIQQRRLKRQARAYVDRAARDDDRAVPVSDPEPRPGP